ncbi:MAG: hypothetical protein LBI28_13670 [Treponema sp.]|jgi:hypothetical protein|nr:hypothetical protein [Treponema sp.]
MKYFLIGIFIILTTFGCTKKDDNKINDSNTNIISDNFIESDIKETVIDSSRDVSFFENNNYKRYYHFSGEYRDVYDDGSIICLDTYNSKLIFTVNEKLRIPEIFEHDYFNWYHVDIDHISQYSNDLILDVYDKDDTGTFDKGGFWKTPIRGVMITQLDDNIYEVNLLDQDSSAYLSYLDKRRFRRISTVDDFSPTHVVEGYDDVMAGTFIYLYENDYNERINPLFMLATGTGFHLILETGSVVEIIEYGGFDGDMQFVKIKYIYFGSENGVEILCNWADLRHLRKL